MTLDADDLKTLERMNKAQLLDLALELKAAAKTVSNKFSQSPGGDCYTYNGSMNDVEWLREALSNFEWFYTKVARTVASG